MENLIKNITKVFDLFLRWIYPGLLFVLLLQLGSEKGLELRNADLYKIEDNQKYSLLIIIIVSSIIIYST